ncbi:BufA2 family periplasmic bufferin-type metallophore [Salaquimonas pukyongi]|uniref:BufA2 family periplasmic bufferin-type metallophore n=1 Tax=Salaquimonas pukyongi TaxID=2712698 RepID=UPI00096B8101|nr:hypothetical protein [Salaquimonas pukyongi]
MKHVGKSGSAIAAAAFALAVAGSGIAVPSGAHAQGEAKIQCTGVNVCKGHSDCKTATSNCKGLNDCKGQGFVSLTQFECEKVGGKWEG